MKKNINYDKLLDLIEAGDAESLLLEENIAGSFNVLMEKNLVHMEQGKVHLTELGKEARNLSVKVVVQRENIKNANLENPTPALRVTQKEIKPRPISRWLWLLIFLSFLLIFFTFQLIK